MSAVVIVLTEAFKCGQCGKVWAERSDAQGCCQCGKCKRPRDDPHRAWCTKCRAKEEVKRWAKEVRERKSALAYAESRLKEARKEKG